MKDDSWGQPQVVVERVELVTSVALAWASGTSPYPRDEDNAGFLRPVDGSPWIEAARIRRLGPNEVQLAIFDLSTLPDIGGRYWLQYRWTPDQFAALRGPWHPAIVASDAIEYCDLTYETLNVGDPAYANEEGSWISVAAWEELVRDDRLRYRTFRWPDLT